MYFYTTYNVKRKHWRLGSEYIPLPLPKVSLWEQCPSTWKTFKRKWINSGGSRVSQTGSANSWFWSEILLFGKVFAEDCIKMEEIGPRGGRVPSVPPPPADPPMNLYVHPLIKIKEDFRWKIQIKNPSGNTLEADPCRSISCILVFSLLDLQKVLETLWSFHSLIHLLRYHSPPFCYTCGRQIYMLFVPF